MGHRYPENDSRQDPSEDALFRVVVRGRIPRNRWDWFGAEEVVYEGPNTAFHIRVLDQSDLFGRLRKIHDLNLILVSVVEAGTRAAREKDLKPSPEGRGPSPQS